MIIEVTGMVSELGVVRHGRHERAQRRSREGLSYKLAATFGTGGGS